MFFFEVGSPVSEDNLSYSCISSDPLATDNDTTPEVKLQDELYSLLVLMHPAQLVIGKQSRNLTCLRMLCL